MDSIHSSMSSSTPAFSSPSSPSTPLLSPSSSSAAPEIEVPPEILAPSISINDTEPPVLAILDLATSGDIISAFASRSKFETLDYSVILLYFFVIAFVGFWSSRKSATGSVSGFFLASRSMHWIPVGASLFASNIGSVHFIGMAGAGAVSGMGVTLFEFNAMFICVVLGWLFVPVYTAAGIHTVPEYLRKRFGGQRIRVYLSSLSLVMYIFTKISADLYAGAIFIKQSLNLDLYSSVIVLLIISALFSIGGGLAAVIWTDFAQAILMLLGSLLLSFTALKEVGGWRTLLDDFQIRSQPNETQYVAYYCLDKNNQSCVSCSEVTDYYNHLFRPYDDPELPWPGILGMIILGTWYWCTDQVIVQRVLSAKNVSHAKAGCLMAALLKVTTLFLIILPGMAARVLWPNEVGCSNPNACKAVCGNEAGCSNIAYPLLILRLMPVGATGLMMSVMMAALVSSLTSIFNSASTIFTIDIYGWFRSRPSEIEQVIVGRVFILILVSVSVAWIPVIESSAGSHFYHYIQAMTSYLAPPVCAVYILAILWPRITEPGAFWALVLGLVCGIARFVLDFLYPSVICADEYLTTHRRPWFVSISYLYFSILLFFFTCAVAIFVSLSTDPIEEYHLYRLTFWSKFSTLERIDLWESEQLQQQQQQEQRKKSKKSSKQPASRRSTLTGQNGTEPEFYDDDSVPKKSYVSNSKTRHVNRSELECDRVAPTFCERFVLLLCCMSPMRLSKHAYKVSDDSVDGSVNENNDANNNQRAQNSNNGDECNDIMDFSLVDPKIRAALEAESARDDPFFQPWTNLAAFLVIGLASFLHGYFA